MSSANPWRARRLYEVFTGVSAHSRYGLHVSTQRAGSAVKAGHRSIHPNIPGVPWWGALLIATIATAVGYAIDAGSGHKDLTHVFAVFYIAGCVAAVLAVRQEGVFTAIIQPPLILFFAVPGAYWLFHGRKVSNLKDLLINCGYPLIERFPLMLGTAGGVLLVGLVRWYFGASHRSAAADTEDDAITAGPEKSHSFISAIGAKMNSLLGLASDENDADDARESKRTRAGGRPRKGAPRTGRAERSGRSAARSSRSHSRHARPPLEDEDERLAERPRRRRPSPPRDVDPADPPRRPRRRPRPEGDPELRGQPPRESGRDSRHSRRDPYERPAPRGSRFDGYDTYEPPYESRPRRANPSGPNGANPTHHPISRVRYRGEAPLNEPRGEPRAEPRAERRSRSRPLRPPAESWEYDV